MQGSLSSFPRQLSEMCLRKGQRMAVYATDMVALPEDVDCMMWAIGSCWKMKAKLEVSGIGDKNRY